jgi:hypothetical protein
LAVPLLPPEPPPAKPDLPVLLPPLESLLAEPPPPPPPAIKLPILVKPPLFPVVITVDGLAPPEAITHEAGLGIKPSTTPPAPPPLEPFKFVLD